MIQENAVHVWYVDLNGLRDSPQTCMKCLSEDELERYRSYVFDIHKERFVKRRFVLKRVLSLYLGLNVEEIRLSYKEGGKPCLNDKIHNSNITFNLSHSENTVVVAIAKDNPVGIDVERIDLVSEIDAMSKMVMSNSEYRTFCTVSVQEKFAMFYRLWSRKESVVKALGLGLSYPIQTVDFHDLQHGKNIVTLDVNQQASNWHVYDLELCKELSSAITTKNDISHIIVKSTNDITQGRIIMV